MLMETPEVCEVGMRRASCESPAGRLTRMVVETVLAFYAARVE